MKKDNEFKMGVSYMLFMLEQEWIASDGDYAVFGNKVKSLMNSELLREAYEQESEYGQD